MAELLDIARLRRLIGEPDDTNGWTDSVLSDIIDANDDLNTAAVEVWESKAAEAASLVDTTESGSSRRMSQLHDQAMRMATYYRGLTEEPTQPPGLDGYAYTLPIERV